MQANPRSIESLFSSQLRYVVPMFQRHYVWQRDPQWSTLWEDVIEKADFQIEGRQTNAHYLGALIDELADFTRHAEVFKRYETAPPELSASDLRRVVRDIDVTTAVPLLQFLELECELSDLQLAQSLSIIESFVVRRAIVGADTKDYNKFFVTVINALKGVAPERIEDALVRKLAVGTGATRRRHRVSH